MVAVRAFASEREVLSLTGLRGLLSLWVVLTHFTIFMPELARHLGPALTVVQVGDRAVDLFFMLSGLVLGLSYATLERGLVVPYRRFLANRIARLFPLHWLMLAVYLAIYALRELSGNKTYDWPAESVAAAANLVLVQNWLTPVWSLNVPAWSASIEWLLYLAFPLLLLPVQRLERRPSMVAALALVLAVAVTLPTLQRDLLALRADWPVYAALATALRGLLPFLAGLLIHRLLLLEAPGTRRFGWLALPAATVLLGLPFLALPSAWLLVPGALLLLALPSAGGPLAWLLSSRPVVRLGDLSFALYMLHYPFFSELPNALSRVLSRLGVDALWLAQALCLASLALAVPLAHHMIEVPARRWLRRRLARAFRAEPTAAFAAKP